LLQPIQLPSGKIVDLSKCIAIVPSANEIDNEMILAGTEQQIQIDAADLEILQAAIARFGKADATPTSSKNPKYTIESRNPVEELQRRQQVSEWMSGFRQHRANLATLPDAERAFEVFTKIVDAERPSGQKLYTAE
jgi:hypothetical protein